MPSRQELTDAILAIKKRNSPPLSTLKKPELAALLAKLQGGAETPKEKEKKPETPKAKDMPAPAAAAPMAAPDEKIQKSISDNFYTKEGLEQSLISSEKSLLFEIQLKENEISRHENIIKQMDRGIKIRKEGIEDIKRYLAGSPPNKQQVSKNARENVIKAAKEALAVYRKADAEPKTAMGHFSHINATKIGKAEEKIRGTSFQFGQSGGSDREYNDIVDKYYRGVKYDKP